LNVPSPAWAQILDQEKIPYVVWSEASPGFSEVNRYPVLILSGKKPRFNVALQSHLRLGGAVIADIDTRSELRGMDHPGRINVLDVSVRDVCQSWSSQRKDFTYKSITVSEVVSARKKSDTRQMVVRAIQKAFLRQNLPYVHLWYYPAGYRSVFSFRFDMDEYDTAGHAVFCELLKKHYAIASCFACLRTFEQFPEAIEAVAASGAEVGSHGYIHHVYRDYTQNKVNFDAAERILKKHGISATSFTAPHGTWYPNLQRLLEERGYLYSSEFSLDYDDFPFFAIAEGRTSRVLQIPTHPVCEGAFFDRYPDPGTMIRNYFDAVIDYKVQRAQPVLFFGHPDHRIGRHPQIFTDIVDRISGCSGVWKTNLRGWATWWIKRHGISFMPEYSNGTIRVGSFGAMDNCIAEIFFPDGRREFMPAQVHPASRIDTAIPPSPVAEFPSRIGMMKRLKSFIKNHLDWETKTPHEMLRITNVQTAIKWFLRLLVRMVS